MKLSLVAVLVAVGIVYVNATLDLACPPALPPVAPLQVTSCFNPKQAIYQKYPLLYKIKAKLCKLCCDPIKLANPCPSGPPLSPLVLAPAPVLLPVAPLPIAPCPPSTVNPQLLSTLLALTAAEAASPALPLQPALSPCTCI